MIQQEVHCNTLGGAETHHPAVELISGADSALPSATLARMLSRCRAANGVPACMAMIQLRTDAITKFSIKYGFL